MINIQKVIKYLAIVFAVFIIFSIFSGIMMGINGLSTIFDDNEITLEKLNNLNINDNVKKMAIELNSTNLIIKNAEEFKVETNNEKLKYKQNNETLFIEDKTKWYDSNNNYNLIIYLPSSFNLNSTRIENGAGKIDIDELNTNYLYLDLGAGKVEINRLTVTKDAEINGGAGEIIIDNSNINDLDLEMGVGKLTLTSILTGENEINAGVGEINLNLIGSLEDYKINLDKGIGNANLNNEKMKDDIYYGTGLNEIEINGGVGNININLSR